MATIEQGDLVHDAVAWLASGVDKYGRARALAPIAIKVRWEEGLSLMVSAFANNVNIVDEIKVDRSLPLQTILWKGLLADVGQSPTPLYRVEGMVETPDLKGREVERWAQLSLYSDELPSPI